MSLNLGSEVAAGERAQPKVGGGGGGRGEGQWDMWLS